MRSPHPTVRAAAEMLGQPDLAPVNPGNPAWRVLARRRLRRGRERVLAVLNAGVCSPDTAVRERALAAAELLRMTDLVERPRDSTASTPEIHIRTGAAARSPFSKPSA
jgi:hypothetical protein